MMSERERLAELERQLRQARRTAEAAAERANTTHGTADYEDAMDAAAEVDRIWQEYGALWRLLNGPAAQPPTA